MPGRAIAERVNGRVVALGTIDTEGRVVNLCLLDVSVRGYGFEAALFESLREWRYRPATVNGEPVATPPIVITEWAARSQY